MGFDELPNSMTTAGEVKERIEAAIHGRVVSMQWVDAGLHVSIKENRRRYKPFVARAFDVTEVVPLPEYVELEARFDFIIGQGWRDPDFVINAIKNEMDEWFDREFSRRFGS